MAQSEEAVHDDSTGGQEPLLRAQLAIEPHPDSSCAVVGAGRDAQEVSHDLKVDPSQPGGSADMSDCSECHAELTFDDDDERAYLTSAVTTNCICPIFQEHDCIPRITGVDSGSIVVALTVPSRETLRAIISDLRTVGATVDVQWLVSGGDSSRTAEIDVSTVTEKQQEALELAMEAGYYETPRRTDLGDIAAELGISESAASQRLNGAETKLVRAFLDD